MKVIMNKVNGDLGLAFKVAAVNEDLLFDLHDFTAAMINSDDIYWAVQAGDKEPFVLVPEELMDRIEFIGDLDEA